MAKINILLSQLIAIEDLVCGAYSEALELSSSLEPGDEGYEKIEKLVEYLGKLDATVRAEKWGGK